MPNRRGAVRIGDRIRVTGNSNGSNYTIGETYTVIYTDHNGTVQARTDDGWTGNSLTRGDYVVGGFTREYMTEKIAKLEEEITNLRSKLAFITEFGYDEFDPQEYAIYQAMETLESPDVSRMGKAKILANLIKEMKL